MSSDTYSLAKLRRRDWLLGTGLILSASCARKKGAGYPGFAIVATSGENSVAAVDLTAFRLVKSIPLPAPPAEVIAGPNGGAYILCPSAGTVSLIGPDLRVAQSRRLADRVSGLSLMPDGKRLAAIAPDSQELIQLAAEDLRVINRKRLHSRPTTLDAVGEWLSLGDADSGSLDLLNLSTGEWRHTTIKGGAGSMRFRSDGKVLLAADQTERLITVLRVPDLAVLVELPLAMQPDNLCFTPDGGQLFVSGPGMDGVAIIFPYNALEVEQTVLAGRDPGAMACSANSPRYLFVANDSGSDVSVMAVDPRKVIGVVEVGESPKFIVLTPDDQYALVLNERSGDLAVIHVAAIRANRNRTGTALFTMLPVGDRPVHCAIVPRQLG